MSVVFSKTKHWFPPNYIGKSVWELCLPNLNLAPELKSEIEQSVETGLYILSVRSSSDESILGLGLVMRHVLMDLMRKIDPMEAGDILLVRYIFELSRLILMIDEEVKERRSQGEVD